ncbi:MAG: hypothetical protein P8176_04625 [Gammaproteobacteria bacterium]
MNNRPVTHSAPAQASASQCPPIRRKIDVKTPAERGESIPAFSRSQASVIEDMRAVSSQSQMDYALENNTKSWEKALCEWVNDSKNTVEKLLRETAQERISDCIRGNLEDLDLSSLGLSSLPSVLHHCKALERFSCKNNLLTQLNLEGCNTLTDIICKNNKINQLSLKGCDALDWLSCENNQLTDLNVEGCGALRSLNCRNNRLNQLNIEGHGALVYLDCGNNQITQLSLKRCSTLKAMSCINNQLTQLNLEGCSGLRELICANNHNLRFDRLDFLLEMEGVRHVVCSNTAIGWQQFPERIRNNQDIYIDIRPIQARHQAFNYAQNTHTESIHRCASRNAVRLKSSNSAQNLPQAYLDFCEWVRQLPVDGAKVINGYANDHYKNLTAQKWIASPAHLDYRDGASEITIKDFLALAWLAAKDSAQRESHVLEIDAKKVLVDALYEIKRGNNLDAAHNPKDNDADADNICAAGTFNKISEKLVSVIQGTTSFMVTVETFRLSLTNMINKAAKTLRKDNRDVDDELKNNNNLLTVPVWGLIKDGVIESIKEEFKDYPEIAGKNIEQHIHEQADYDQVLQYFSVS